MSPRSKPRRPRFSSATVCDRWSPICAGPEECDRVVAETRARFGAVDILVNNAGLTFTYIDPPRFSRGTIQKFFEVGDEIIDNVITTNYLAADRLSRRVAPAMIEAGWGRIVNVTTKLDTMNRTGTHPYGASKAALELATEVWAKDVAGTGLTVNIVNRHQTDALDVTIALEDKQFAGTATVAEVNGPGIKAMNDFTSNPVGTKTRSQAASGNSLTLNLAAHSYTQVRVNLA